MEWLESFLDISAPTNHVFHIEFLRPKFVFFFFFVLFLTLLQTFFDSKR